MRQFKVKWLCLALVTLFLVSAGSDGFAIRRARRRSGSMVYRVKFTANVNARIFIDGRRKLFTTAKNPTFKINGGRHSLRLVPLDSKYQPLNTKINVVRNQTFSFTLKQRGETRSSVFNVTINTNVPAKVFINNRYKGSDGRNMRLAAGIYNLRVQANDPGYRMINTRIRVNRNQVFNYTLRADSKRVVFNTNVPARIYINNRYRGMGGTQIMLPAGVYSIRVQATTPGYSPLNTQIRIIRNQAFNFTLRSPMGMLRVNLPRQARLRINGRRRGFRPGQPLRLAAGTYRIMVRYYSLRVRRTIQVQAGRTSSLNLRLELENR